ncbi:cation diffusion facilitator family transporter [Okibacterium endophyticum]
MAHDHAHSTSNRARLILVIIIVSVVLIVEVVGGVLSGSLSLLADAGHMFSDLAGLCVALFAVLIAARPASDRHTYGFRRTEVFGALVNGVILTVLAVWIGAEGMRRLTVTGDIEILGMPMLVVAVVGLIANVASLIILRGGAKNSINLRGAYLEVFGDALGSLAVIVAAVIIMATGWLQADAVASVLIALGILPRAFALLRDVWRVLNEGAPHDTDVALIRRHILETDGVVDVHDVHVWSITSGEPVFTAHVAVDSEVFTGTRAGQLLDQLGDCLSDHFDVAHSTFQLEPVQHAEHESHEYH